MEISFIKAKRYAENLHIFNGKTISLFIQNPIAGLVRAFGHLLNASLSFGVRECGIILHGFGGLLYRASLIMLAIGLTMQVSI